MPSVVSPWLSIRQCNEYPSSDFGIVKYLAYEVSTIYIVIYKSRQNENSIVRLSICSFVHLHQFYSRHLLFSPLLQVFEAVEHGAQDASSLLQEEALLSQAEHRLQCKERQLLSLCQNHLPAVSEERQRAEEALDRMWARGAGGRSVEPSPDQVEKELDETLYQVRGKKNSHKSGLVLINMSNCNQM